MITRHFGSVAASAIKNVDIEKLPILALIYRLRGTTEIFQVLDEIIANVVTVQVQVWMPEYRTFWSGILVTI